MINLITELLPHQKNAFDKMKNLKIGALYMEQGTGKTRTTLELIKYRLDKNKIDKVLWLCPCSTKTNLRNEIIKHTGQQHEEIITICGIETLSNSIKTFEKMREFVSNNRVFVVIDESLLIKNFFAKRTKNILELSKCCEYRILLNGTPISKNEIDLFAQWYSLDWRILGYRSFYSFAANHLEKDMRYKGKVVQCLNTDYLTEKISPYTFQISKNECVKLPDKIYQKLYFKMTEEQQEHYINTYNVFFPYENKEIDIYRFFSAMTAVVSGFHVSETVTKEEIEKPDGVRKTKIIRHMKTKPFFEDVHENPRIKTLLSYITDDEKVIIFAKYKQEIDDIIFVLEKKFGKGCCVKFDGSISLKQRTENQSKFEKDDNVKFFVANKVCAGYGLNLQFCHNIIFYNNDWNLGTRLQAEDRVHRLGQKEEVNIIDIVCESTLDEAIIDCLERKEGLLNEIKSFVKEKNGQNLKDLLSQVTKINKKVTSQEDNLDEQENI